MRAASTAARLQALLPHISPRRVLRFREVLQQRVADTIIVLENVADPRNLSACLRTADALGMQHLCLIERWGSVDPLAAVDKGAGKWLSIHRFKHVADCCAYLRQERAARIYATDLNRGALPLGHAVQDSLQARQPSLPQQLRPPVALVFGNEHRGCSKALLEAADARFFIPQAGFVQSLNLSVACSIAGSAFLRRTPEYEAALISTRNRGLVINDGHDWLAADDEASPDAPKSTREVRAREGDEVPYSTAPLPSISPSATPMQSGPGTGVGRLTEEEQDELLLRMLVTSVNHAERILERKGLRPEEL